MDSATQVAQDSAPARHGAGAGVAVADAAGARPETGSVPPAHVADNGAGSGAAPSDHQIADTPTDPALAEQPGLAEVASKVEKLDTTGIAYYAPDGKSTPTSGLIHPQAALERLVYPGQHAGPGLPADSPLVQRQLPEDFTMWGGKTREEYAELYADGTRPNGAPRIRSDAWRDDQLHPEGFRSSPRNPEHLWFSNPATSSTATAYPSGDSPLR